MKIGVVVLVGLENSVYKNVGGSKFLVLYRKKSLLMNDEK